MFYVYFNSNTVIWFVSQGEERGRYLPLLFNVYTSEKKIKKNKTVEKKNPSVAVSL